MLILTFTCSTLADRGNAEQFVGDGNKAFFEGQYDNAVTNYTSAIAEDPNWAVPYNNRGLARFHLGDFDNAITDFDKAKELEPSHAASYLNIGKCLAAQKRFDEAIEEFQNGLVIEENNSSLLYNIGWIYDEQQQYEDANNYYTLALNSKPDHYRAKLSRSITRAKQGHTQQAITDFYDVINATEKGDMLLRLAAYNLQHHRGPGIDFHSEQAALKFQEGIFLYTTEQYNNAILFLEEAEVLESDVPEIPWMMSWTSLMNRESNTAAAGFSLAKARALQQRLTVDSIQPGADIFIDGVPYGTTPQILHLFPSKYDLTLRKESNNLKREWSGPSYTTSTGGQGISSMLLGLETVPEFSNFGPVEDEDVDWLADTWEENWFGNLDTGPEDDLTDNDLLLNLYEHWSSTDPTKDDSDTDGVNDFDEVFIYKSDPTQHNIFYYVNDADLSGDIWCTGIGDNANDGTSPATPKASMGAILSEYDLIPGSIVCVDTGYYILSENVELTKSDGGDSSHYVVVQGSGSGTIIDRNTLEFESSCIVLNGTEYVIVRSMQLINGYNGITLNETSSCRIQECDLLYNWYSGLLSIGVNSDLEIRNTLASRNIDGFCFENQGTSEAMAIKIRNCTLAYNIYSGINCIRSAISVQNSVFVALSEHSACIKSDRTTFYGDRDFNCYHTSGGALIGLMGTREYSTLLSWQNVVSDDLNSINVDPLFVGLDDYHLQSTAGHYNYGEWKEGFQTSPCLDMGNIYEPFDKEPLPNGNRVNLGRYGGTKEASKSGNELKITLFSPNGGEYLSGEVPVRWTASGTGWQVGDTIKIEYSSDGGASWTLITHDIPFAIGSYLWDTRTAIPESSPLFLVRISNNQYPSIFDQSEDIFRVQNNGTQYYVNDGSTINDEWCTAPGDDSNNGIGPTSPKATVHAILEEYNLEPNDVVHIDTGTYEFNSNIAIGSQDQGSRDGVVTFSLSPYGVTFDPNSQADYCWHLNGDYLSIRTANGTRHENLPQRYARITRGRVGGIYVGESYCTVERLEITDNGTYGISVRDSRTTCRNNVITANGSYGVYVNYSNTSLYNNTIERNGREEVYVRASLSEFKNNIVCADGPEDQAMYLYNQNYVQDSDYNCYSLTNGAKVSNVGDTLAAWQQTIGKDSASISMNPLFADPNNSDYHLKSQAGRWNPDSETWVIDDVTSPCIDAGDPNSPIGDEPHPNGNIINIGAFGGTLQASKSKSE